MKTKYFVLAVLCCTMFGACQNNDPNKGGNEVINQLEDFVDGIGKIVDTQTLDDGSVVMKDDKGNTITKDKDGNVVIVSQQGDSTYIDNSIKEDESVPKDKWYRSTWKGSRYIYGKSYPDLTYDFLQKVMRYFGDIQYSFVNVDSTSIHKDSVVYINLHFNTTTCSWQNVDTLKEITQTGIFTFQKFQLTEQQINDYTLEFEENNADLYAVIYQNERLIDYCRIDKDSTISLYYNYRMTQKIEKILETGVNTTFFNYRRINDTQIAVINNSLSYLLKEEKNNSSMPQMKIYKDSEIISTLELISL